MSAEPAVAATPVDGLVFRAFRGLASVRRARAFHPVGAAYRGIANVGAAAPDGVPPGEWPVVVRFSRGIGLPAPWPDLLGIGVRIDGAAPPGGPVDLLMTTTGSGPLGRHVLRPTRSFSSGRATSLLPYAGLHGRLLFAARILSPEIVGLDDIGRAGAPHGPGVGLELSWSQNGGDWLPFAGVHVHLRLEPDEERALDLDPFHAAAGLVPAGLVNRLRRPAYPGSREGRPTG